ncbi:MAG TPA: PKD domain-containing protein, partial [Baekduia sp.]|nr:PKD domain-containing protein [Baekduia sp.]
MPRIPFSRTATLAAVLACAVGGVAHGAGFGQLGSPIGDYGTGEASFSNVLGLDAQDATDDLFVGDTRPIQDGDELEFRIHQFHDGAFVRNIGVDPSNNGLFSGGARYARLAADPRAGQPVLYQTRPVEGANGDKVLRFSTATGAAQGDFAPSLLGQGGGKLDDPIAVAVDPDNGDVILGGTTTGDNVVVRRYSAAGALVGNYSVKDTGDNNLRDVAAGPGGTVYVAQFVAGTGGTTPDTVAVERFTATGQPATDELDAPATTTDLDVTPAGDLLVGGTTADAEGHYLTLYDYDAGQAAGSRFVSTRAWATKGGGTCQLSQGAPFVAADATDLVSLDFNTNAEPSVARVLRFGNSGTGCGFDPIAPSGAGFAVAPTNPTKNQEVTFTASATDDGPLTDASYTWSFGDGATATGRTVKHTFTANGAREVTLTVTDADALTATVKKTVTVTSQAPTAAFTAAPTTLTAGASVSFDGSGSRDPDGTIARYEWDFDGDGVFDAEGATVAHAYGTAGSYQARLRVTDDDGRTASTSRTITVTTVVVDHPNPPVDTTPTPTPGGGGKAGGPIVGAGDKTPAASIKGGALTADAKGVITVTVSCPAGGAACTGTLTLKTAGAIAAKSTKKKVLTLGTA